MSILVFQCCINVKLFSKVGGLVLFYMACFLSSFPQLFAMTFKIILRIYKVCRSRIETHCLSEPEVIIRRSRNSCEATELLTFSKSH